MRRAISQAGAVGKNRIVEQRRAVSLTDAGHLLDKIRELLHVKMIHPGQVVDELGLVMGHRVMAARLVEDTLKHVRRVPSLRPDHHRGHPRQAGLQRNDHQVSHQADVLPAGQVGIDWLVDGGLGQAVFHSGHFFHLLFNRPDGVEVLVKFVLILAPQFALKRACILQHEVGDVSKLFRVPRAEQSTIGLLRVAHRRRDMPSAVP